MLITVGVKKREAIQWNLAPKVIHEMRISGRCIQRGSCYRGHTLATLVGFTESTLLVRMSTKHAVGKVDGRGYSDQLKMLFVTPVGHDKPFEV